MERDNIKTVTITHPAERVKEYRWLAGFFRLLGIWVCENILGETHGDPTDFYIEIQNEAETKEKKPENKSWKDIRWKETVESEYSALNLEDMDSTAAEEYEEKNWLQVILSTIKGLFSDHTWLELKFIAEQYVKYDLMRASYAVEYFANSDDYEIYEYMNRSKNRFYQAYKVLESWENEHSSKYLLAAICNCQRRFNELYTVIWNACQNEKLEEKQRVSLLEYLKEKPYQEYEQINTRIVKILEKDPGYYGAYAIRGFVKQIDNKLLMESVYDFDTAVRICGKKSYASYLLYRIGRHFEMFRKEQGMDMEFYHESYRCDNYNYRAIYKLAMYYKSHEQYDMSLEYWDKLLKILEPKKALPSLQPIECAYIYKTYYNTGLILEKEEHYRLAITFFEKAKEMGQNVNNLDFYDWMFGEKGKVFKQAAVKKLDLPDCNAHLSNAYAMVNSMEGIFSAYE